MLNLLIDAVAAGTIPPRLDAAAFGRETNAARKLDRLDALVALPAIDRERLRAVGRVRACLFHCDGTAHAGTVRADLRAATARSGGLAPADGKLALASRELAAICDFYGVVAAGLLAASAAPALTFRGSGSISVPLTSPATELTP